MEIEVYKDGLRKYNGEPTDREIEVIHLNKKMTFEEIDELPIGSLVYVTDTCEYPFYMNTSGIRIKVSSSESEGQRWGLKRIGDPLFWGSNSVLDGRVEVYSLQ